MYTYIYIFCMYWILYPSPNAVWKELGTPSEQKHHFNLIWTGMAGLFEGDLSIFPMCMPNAQFSPTNMTFHLTGGLVDT